MSVYVVASVMALLVDSRFVVGVKVPVQVLPSSAEASVLRVPPATVRSALAKPLTFSLKVIVTRLLSPAWSALSASTMLAVGALVSMVIEGVVPVPPVLPAASVYRPLATVMLALPEARSDVGVKVAV